MSRVKKILYDKYEPADLNEVVAECTHLNKEKQEKLNSICREFSTIASSYGFTLDDIITEVTRMKKE